MKKEKNKNNFIEQSIKSRDEVISSKNQQITLLNDLLRSLQIEYEEEIHKNQILENMRKEISDCTATLDSLNKEFIKQAEVLEQLRILIDQLNKEKNQYKLELEKKKFIIEKQRDKILKFSGSVVYPFYLITSAFGKTKFGQMLQKLLK